MYIIKNPLDHQINGQEGFLLCTDIILTNNLNYSKKAPHSGAFFIYPFFHIINSTRFA